MHLEDSNSCPHGCTASALAAGPSPQPQCLWFVTTNKHWVTFREPAVLRIMIGPSWKEKAARVRPEMRRGNYLLGADCSSIIVGKIQGEGPRGVKRLNVLLASPSINLTRKIMRLLWSEHFLIESEKICFIFSKSSVMSIINFTIRGKKRSRKSVWLFLRHLKSWVGRSACRSLACSFLPTWRRGV